MTDTKKFTAFVFCRGGSKGIPNKNIKPLAGKPLLAHTVDCARSSRLIDNVVVSTDSERIAEVAAKYGATPLIRPSELAADASPEILAWRHAVGKFGDDNLSGLFISLPATAPLRATEDIDSAIHRYQSGDCDIVFGISRSQRNPYLNMVRVDDAGHIHVVNRTSAVRRQDVPDVYDITTCVYVGGVEYVMTCESLMAGRVGYIEIPVERSLDIDDPFDFHLAELLMQNPFAQISRGLSGEG